MIKNNKKALEELLNKNFVIPKLTTDTEKVILNYMYGAKPSPEEKTCTDDKWIWIEGYKGTDKDMKCRDYQFTLGDQYDMPEDANIETCKSGFHLCKNLEDVFNYYKVADGNRFFKVAALVRESDVELEYDNKTRMIGYPFYHYGGDKLAAKSIVFLHELTADEILETRLRKVDNCSLSDWSDELKQMAIEENVYKAINKHHVEQLMRLGYSKALTMFIINQDLYDRACEVATIPEDISMDVRIAMIFTGLVD